MFPLNRGPRSPCIGVVLLQALGCLPISPIRLAFFGPLPQFQMKRVLAVLRYESSYLFGRCYRPHIF